MMAVLPLVERPLLGGAALSERCDNIQLRVRAFSP